MVQEGAFDLSLQIISDASEGQTVWRYGGGAIQKVSTSLNISAGRQSMRSVHNALLSVAKCP